MAADAAGGDGEGLEKVLCGIDGLRRGDGVEGGSRGSRGARGAGEACAQAKSRSGTRLTEVMQDCRNEHVRAFQPKQQNTMGLKSQFVTAHGT